MQKSKKLLAVLLAMVMALSTLSAAMMAFAEDANASAQKSWLQKLNIFDGDIKENIANLFSDVAGASEDVLGGLYSLLDDGDDADLIGGEPVVYAADATVSAVEKKMSEFDGKMNTTTPSEEDKAAYDDIVASFKALTVDQKDTINPFIFDKFLRKYYDYEKAVAGNTSTAGWKAAQAKIPEVLGEVRFLQQAEEAGKVVAKSGAAYGDMIDALKKCTSEAARLFAGCWYDSYGAFYYGPSSSYDSKKTLDKVLSAATKAFPNEEQRPAYPSSKPNKDKFEQGENDPEYIKAMELYAESSKKYAEWYAGDYNCQGIAYGKALEALAQFAPEYKAMAEYYTAAREVAVKELNGEMDTPAAKKALAAHDAMPENYAPMIDGFTKYAIGYTVPKGGDDPGYDYKNIYIRDLIATVTNIAKYENIVKFNELMASYEEPLTLSMFEKANELFKETPAGKRGDIDADAMKKYNELCAMYVRNELNPYHANLDSFVQTDVEYPLGASWSKVEHFLGAMDPTVSELLAGLIRDDSANLTEVIEKGVYTNAAIGTVMKLVYPLLSGLNSLVAADPAKLAGTLKEEKFAGAVASLNKAQEDGNKAYSDAVKAHDDAVAALDAYNKGVADGTIDPDKNTAPVVPEIPSKDQLLWDMFNPQNGDFGFQDGDKEGFLDGMSVLFRPVSLVCSIFTFENQQNNENPTETKFKLYEHLTNIFEALGLEAPNSFEYTTNVNNAPNQYDARLRPILEVVMNLVDEIAANPVTTLFDLLPKLAYALDTGLINKEVNAIIDERLLPTLVTIPNVDLTTDGLIEMIIPMLLPLVDGAYYENGVLTLAIPVAEGADIAVKVSKDSIKSLIKELAGCGNLTEIFSNTSKNVYAAVVEANAPDAFVTVFRWICRFVKTDVIAYNVDRLAEYVKDQGLSVIGWKIGVLAEAIRRCNGNCDAALVALVNILDLQLPQLPSLPDFDLPEFPNLELPNLGGIFDFIGGIFDGIKLPDLGGILDGIKLPDFGGILDTIGGIFGGIFDFIGGLFGGGDGGDDGNEPDDGDGDMFPSDDDDDGLGGDVDADDIPNTASATAGAVFAALAVLSAAGAAVVAYKRKDDEE